MLVGYVSDELDSALSDVAVEIDGDEMTEPIATRSRASGSVFADLPEGRYRVTLAHPGYGAKRSEITVVDGQPHRFRLLSDRLLGYAWPKWLRSGESAEFRVHSPEPYKLDLYRYGLRRELVQRLGWFDDHGPRATIQLTPDGDFTQSGIRWNQLGYGSAWHQQRVTAPTRSGLYYFEAATSSGQHFSFPWIVAPAAPRAPIAVLAHNLTWNAYNAFGGRSNYVSQAGLGERPTVHARADLLRFTQPGTWPFTDRSAPLSFDRPEPHNVVPAGANVTDPIEGRLESAMAPGEWRLLAWLEREGFDYDLYADTQLHSGVLDLDRYKVVITNNHPEYATPEMYMKLKTWVHKRGGRLMYLGGCGFYAEAELPVEASRVCREEGLTTLRGESEAHLLGVNYTHSGYQSAAPYRVLDAAHWAFVGTGLNNDDLFGFDSLHMRCPGGASGHELDKIGPDAPPGIRLLAKGTNSADAGGEMAIYNTPSGGSVFAVGSLCWPLSLLVDRGTSAVTANVLRRLLI
jgi:N,N-dimethylformamidase